MSAHDRDEQISQLIVSRAMKSHRGPVIAIIENKKEKRLRPMRAITSCKKNLTSSILLECTTIPAESASIDRPNPLAILIS